MHSPSDTVAVTLIDESTGEKLATSHVPVAQLPETFAIETSLDIAGQRYTVVRADPPTKLEFAHRKTLTLHLQKVELLNPNDVLFSLPTLCGAALPETAVQKTAGSIIVLHEDDFRQCEYVALTHAADIAADLEAIQTIFETASAGAGWSKMHVRTRIENPLPSGLTWKDVTSRLGRIDPIAAVALGEPRRVIRGARAASMRNGIVLWTVEQRGELGCLCLHNPALAAPSTVAALKRLADELSLALVDWCRMRVYASGQTITGSLGDPWADVQ